MKNLLSFIFILVFTVSFSQNEEVITVKAVTASDVGERNDDIDFELPFAVVEHVPRFKACEDSDNIDQRTCFQEKMAEHIKKTIKYSKEIKKTKVSGKVIILFVIDKSGNVVNVRSKGNNSLLVAEAERIINKLPQFKPAMHRGKPVAMAYAVPINFEIQ
jgi:protein TonB